MSENNVTPENGDTAPESDDGAPESDDSARGDSGLEAMRCPDGHVTYPSHPVCPDCGDTPTETVDLSTRVGTVLTWTTVAATPVGVREPNTLAIVAFDVDGQQVTVLGGTTDDVAIGDRVEPVYVEQLRDPTVAIRDETSQAWDGYRFEPLEEDSTSQSSR